MLPFPQLFNNNINDPLAEYNRFTTFMNSNISSGVWSSLNPQNPCGWPATNKGTPVKMDLSPDLQGVMYGTSWGSRPRWNSTCFRALQHCFPNKESFDFNYTNKLFCVYFTSANSTFSPYVSLNRNGYQSLYSSAADTGVIINKFIYFDPSNSKMMILNPSAMSAPLEYIF